MRTDLKHVNYYGKIVPLGRAFLCEGKAFEGGTRNSRELVTKESQPRGKHSRQR